MFVSKHRAMPKAKPTEWDSSSSLVQAGEVHVRVLTARSPFNKCQEWFDR